MYVIRCTCTFFSSEEPLACCLHGSGKTIYENVSVLHSIRSSNVDARCVSSESEDETKETEKESNEWYA